MRFINYMDMVAIWRHDPASHESLSGFYIGLPLGVHWPRFLNIHMSRLMGKPTICIGENKDADQLRGNREADQLGAFVFATRVVQFLFYLNPKFQDSSSFLCLYRPVCVRPVRKPHCWFSHEAAHILGEDGVVGRASCSMTLRLSRANS